MNDYSTYETHQQGLPMGVLIGYLVVVVLMLASMWKIYSKAGKPGWACIIPIYSTIVLLEIVGKPMWWFILMLLPIVNIIVAIIVMANLASSFGKGGGFVVGLILLPIVFLPMLAFGSAQYVGPGGGAGMAGGMPQARAY